MLDEQQSSQIVSDCIRAVSHVDSVDFTGSLDDAEISDDKRVQRVINKIVKSKKIGVPSKGHQIDAGLFSGVDSNTIVDAVVEIVRTGSVVQ